MAAAGYGYWAVHRPLEPGPDAYVIPPGTGISQLARRLVERGVVDEPYSLVAWAYLQGQTQSIKAGEYAFESGINLIELLRQTVEGSVIQYSLDRALYHDPIDG